MLPGVFVNVRYKCEYVHLFLHMTALHTVTYAQYFFRVLHACARACIQMKQLYSEAIQRVL